MSMSAVLKELKIALNVQKMGLNGRKVPEADLVVKAHGLEVHSIKEMSDGVYMLHGKQESTGQEAMVLCEYFIPMVVVEPNKDREPIGFKIETAEQ